MRTRLVALLVASTMMATGSAALATPAEDATAAVTSVLDKFATGDINAFFAAHRDGALIVDEFAPYVWGGPQSVQ
ncbi:hypothetical protein, partial [Sphingomonas sp.]|uniref:hypothetical protein n=1 Tax=Sphingomonas sp. TaxID=28214 RepID=UPI00286C5FEC